jgi:peptide/nickel transport system permease protein
VIGYIVRRLGTSIIVLLLVAIGIFWLLHVIYPDPGIGVLGARANKYTIAVWNRQNGFDDPWIVQFIRYLGHTVTGNFGYSYKLNQSVDALFGQVWARSAWLSGASLVLAVLIAIPLGIFQAVRRNTVGDYAATGVAFILYAMPVFFLGLIMIDLFALKLHWFPTTAAQGDSIISIMTNIKAMALPIATLVLLSIAAYSRYMRSSSMEVLAHDYIKVARAKGLPERLVLFRHLLRNACLPMVTLIGLSIPALLAGNLITEELFNFHGLGLLFYNSLQNEDYNILLAYTMLGALLTIIGNLVADIALTVADPRIRLA